MFNPSDFKSRSQALAALLTLLFAGAAVCGVKASAQSESAEPVSLYVTVVKGDKLVNGLRAQNFRLYEDGQRREFRLAEPELPVSIVLLLEYSRSSYFYFADIQEAVRGFTEELPEGNWYALSTFSKDMEVKVDFTKLGGRIVEGFGDLGSPLWSEVNTYDAVYEALDALGRLPGRRVLIVVGSGTDTFSGRTLDDVRKKLQSVNATVYAVGAGSELRGRYEPYLGGASQMRLRQAQAFLQMLADESGGEAWFPRFENAFPGAMQGILQDIACQYRLLYSPQVPSDGKLHKIKVEAFQLDDDKRQNFKVLSRVGWRSEA